MRFHEYIDHFTIAKQMGLVSKAGIHTREELYNVLISSTAADPIGARHLVFDKAWHEIGKPYYDVYPSIIPMLTKLNLAFSGKVISPPGGIRHLLLRFPDTPHELCVDDMRVRCAFLSFQKVNRAVGSNIRENGIAVGLDFGEKVGGMPVYTMRVFSLDERTIEETIFSLKTHPNTFYGMQVPDKLILDTVRLALTVCLIDDNAEFLERQVLSKDNIKFSTAKTDEEKTKLYNKAKRRGKWAFSLGKSIEIIPHYRRPHPAIVWTGKGRTILKIIMRKGSLIHKNKIEQVPTGYDDEQQE